MTAAPEGLGGGAMNETRVVVATPAPDVLERVGRMEEAWSASGRASDPLDVRDKVVAAGLALGTALMLTMLGLGPGFVLALALMSPVLTRPSVRRRLFPPHRETFAAYYVAWLYGPLGWGAYKGVRWAQVLGGGLVVAATLSAW